MRLVSGDAELRFAAVLSDMDVVIEAFDRRCEIRAYKNPA